MPSDGMLAEVVEGLPGGDFSVSRWMQEVVETGIALPIGE